MEYYKNLDLEGVNCADNEIETWEDIPGYENVYQISKDEIINRKSWRHI
jgi:hypothetical protein